MARSDYLSANDDAFNAQLQTFKNAIGAYAAAIGVTPAQVTTRRPTPITSATPSLASN